MILFAMIAICCIGNKQCLVFAEDIQKFNGYNNRAFNILFLYYLLLLLVLVACDIVG